MLLGIGLFIATPMILAQTKAKDIPPDNATGADLYRQYCASCHGADGHGHGPATEALKTPPTDLTMIAKQNNGKFDAKAIKRVIQGEKHVAAHGSSEMPSWGTSFRSATGNQAAADARINLLVTYIQSIQR